MRDAFLTQPHGVFVMDTMAELPLDPIAVRRAAHVQRLAEVGPREIREISAARLQDPQRLAKAARRALESGCRLWVLSIDDEATLSALHERFGDALVALGPETEDGRRAYGISPADATRWLLKEHPDQAEIFEGADAAGFPHDLLATLSELTIPVRHRSAISTFLRNPRVYVYLVVFIYSALRALPVVFVKEFHGSVLMLWSIDIITAVPYTWGVIAMVTGSTRRTRILGALTTIVTFVAPYVYFGLHGRDYPPYVIVVIAVLVFSGLGLEVAKFRQERGLEKRYAAVEPRRVTSS
ncbi:hypothetical protein [Tessaracoccus caeni]|uniref:hypothetical protein n=1 Tax=Tessaracoccus caeni TaxID=3031239 RepID=UPI0023DAD671|nr:hypothetical protein [Tessaracoccus caeni]MDF1489210.1 hypothetical protein [Tessaracoccus caeni]